MAELCEAFSLPTQRKNPADTTVSAGFWFTT